MPAVNTPQSTYYDQITGAQPVGSDSSNGLTKQYDQGGGGSDAKASSSQAVAGQGQQQPARTNAVAYGNVPLSQDAYNKLFSPIQQQVSGAQQQLSGAQQNFQQQAGSQRNYESVGGQDTLSRAISGNPTAAEAGKALVGASYSGPSGLDSTAIGNLNKTASDLRTQTGALNTAAGTAEVLKSGHHGLSQGERDYQAGLMLRAPEYRKQAQALQSAVQGLFGQTASAEQQAEQYAAQRQAGEQDIADKSKQYLTGQQGTITDALSQRVNEDNAKSAALQAAYDKFRASGSQADLEALNAAGAHVDTSNFFNPQTQLVQQAQQVKSQVMGRPEYASIQNAPLMELGLNKHGREVLQVPQQWWNENTKEMTSAQKTALKSLLTRRQQDLERSGFSPGTGAALNANDPLRQELNRTAGQFSAVDPLYFGEDVGGALALKNPNEYVSFSPGMAATNESVASADERARYNAIASLMGQSGMAESNPYSLGTVSDEGARFKDELSQALEGRQKQLATDTKNESAQVARARKKVRASGQGLKGLANFATKALPGAPGASVLKGGMGLGINMGGGKGYDYNAAKEKLK